MEYYQLANGMQLPKIGFGTYKLKGAAGARSITAAINNGYRLLDSAYNYENEGALGRGIRDADVSRSDLLVTSKLPGRYYHYDDAIQTIQESLYRSQLDYFDLYLLHWPNPKDDHYVEAWQALIDAQRFGLVRAIGVCNFLPDHLDRLKRETGVLPQLNQIELHPYFNQLKQRQYDDQHGILTEDWSPLGRASTMLNDPILIELARKYSKDVVQLILRWEIQLNTLPIPKSSSDRNQLNNLQVFDFSITPADMDTINGLTKLDGRTHDQDPATYQEF
ncbi:aldo/keto reductase [Fructilactobacillus cliffordii]|uniref:Aldo/keto reductase n=1 Tax=Fructilactobacillus cliffordii TaxID=2940299 RepID=A0A9Q8ZTY5_9LACO|nr:aldo/keto reductase [Fructilactobacillus cliffordii]USS86168.1 aldo/keto reductase [Fructilactobacillus cliffordii]USS89237.1 aldo/keto reductase [Fructilactobacillus cliffordii]